MIKTDQEYQEAIRRLEQDQEVANQQRASLRDLGLSEDEVEHAMEPLLSFQAQLAEEVAWYEGIRRRDFSPFGNLTELGRLLIALRIANGLSQRELAERLGVHESQISRDERNEYRGITIERVQRIVEAMNERVSTRVEERELVLA